MQRATMRHLVTIHQSLDTKKLLPFGEQMSFQATTDLPVTRNQWKDKASNTHRSLLDKLRTYFKLRDKRIVKGRNIIVKSDVDIALTDNAVLEIGDETIIDRYAFLQLTKPAPHLVLGKYVGIGRGTVLAVKGKTTIGDYTQLGPFCQINDQGHSFELGDLIMNQKAIISGVTIGKDCWLGSGVRVLMGVTIGDGSVVGAGSIVNKNIPPNEIWAGVPARFIKKR
jgi:acetyltransferase-like isoleucine patch superfamily enzyme